jgi:hypothetical protein
MKLGKRRREADAPEAADAEVSVAEPAADGEAAPVAVAHEQPIAYEPEPYEEPSAHEPESAAYDEPVVEGEAIELPIEHVPAQAFEPAAAPAMRQPHDMPFPIADEPVAVVTADGEPPQVSSLGDAGEAYASGHAPTPGPSWQEPVMELANERPELVVAAAFAGGVLAAMILRRLGN